MDKIILKSFATESRNKLIDDVIYRLSLIGITKNGIQDSISESEGIETFQMGNTTYSIYDNDISKRNNLILEINSKGFNAVVEEVAYTWFNRIIAIRFMELNNYLPSKTRVLSSETSNKLEPDIINEALDLDFDYSNEEKEFIINLKNENKLDELFRFLFLKQCNQLNNILPELFEETTDCFDLLLNISYINENGVVRNLIDNIPESYFENVEIIGWLYQFYISEKKDSVNTSLKSKPIQKQDIPAATQLFTPDWIVKYMVDNSLGRYWIERNENSLLKNYLQYLFEEPEQSEDVLRICNELRSNSIDVKDMKFFDSCMGSGHILVYAFDVFMEIYKELGYLEREIPELILTKNLFGLDIDKRAYQLAYFALMMKGRKYDRKLFKKNIPLNIHPIIDSNLSEDTLNFIKNHDLELYDEINYLNEIFNNASEFGSLIKVKDLDYNLILEKINSLISNVKNSLLDYNIINEIENKLISLINQAKLLSLKYDAVVTNPPYLNKYDKQLKEFSKKNYKDYSKDLFSMFIYRNFDFCKEDGYTAFMTPMVWMFIKNYEKLRKFIIENKSIITLIELEYLALWEIEAYVPACTFVLSNQNYDSNYNGSFLKLTEYKGGLAVQNEKVLEALNHNDKNKYLIKQNNFDKIPGSPIAYWVDDNLIACFNNTKLESLGSVKQGLATADNNRFLRFWYEVDFNKIGFSSKT
ncbi:MAG: BREX-1 system adenine-specific DNA-methyltransferase PglX, partial [Methanobrevibacter sp.]|uniref:BREX-1 system adenine-specific DNA-methyltransferase PglX n=1 Tax=Methanobrevibacter sp. TaxID=66852 RepID=UPI001B7ACE83